jgi:hypothetical protein
MDITEWFNPLDKNHINAYKYLNKNGSWPKNFIPEDIKFSLNWQLTLLEIMTKEWLSLFKD